MKKLLLIVAVLIVIGAIGNLFTKKPTAAQKQLEDSLATANKKAESEASVHKQLPVTAYLMSKKFLKASLRDPDSFDEHEKSYNWVEKTKDSTEIEVMIDYSAKNGFGGMNRTKHYFHFTKNLVLTEEFKE